LSVHRLHPVAGGVDFNIQAEPLAIPLQTAIITQVAQVCRFETIEDSTKSGHHGVLPRLSTKERTGKGNFDADSIGEW